ERFAVAPRGVVVGDRSELARGHPLGGADEAERVLGGRRRRGDIGLGRRRRLGRVFARVGGRLGRRGFERRRAGRPGGLDRGRLGVVRGRVVGIGGREI